MLFLTWWLSSLFQATSSLLVTETGLRCTAPPCSTPTSNFGSSGTQDERSAQEIVQTCLTIWFLCAWVVMHPNISSPGETTMKALGRRLDLMVWGMLFPELILWWAIKQWAGARVIEEEYSMLGHRWTMTHGFYMIMGGFTLYDGEHNLGVLSFERFKALYNAGEIDFPTITEEEINDKSSADMLSKLITVSQAVWFGVQYARRTVDGLIITELEVVTLAQCVFPAILYYFWWYKPMGVSTSTKVYLKSPTQLNSDEDVTRDAVCEPQESVQRIGWIGKLIAIVSLPVTFCRISVDKCLLILQSSTIEDGADHVPAFYAPDLMHWRTEGFALVVAITAGTLFGAVHCLAWHFAMPTLIEVHLWRTASVVLTIIPVAELVLLFVTICTSEIPIVAEKLETVMVVFTGLSIVLYPIVRCYLLFDSLFLLRQYLPPVDYQ